MPWREAGGRAGGDRRGRSAAAGFDLAGPPLLRVALVRDTGRSHVVLTLHHIATDGWSAPLLIRELLAHYVPAASRRGSRRSRRTVAT